MTSTELVIKIPEEKAETLIKQMKLDRNFRECEIIELPKGHWELGGYDDMYYVCNKCGYKVSEYYHKPSFKYCPNCGAKMVDPQESKKINCKTTKCENCQNHNYCDYEPQESEEV